MGVPRQAVLIDLQEPDAATIQSTLKELGWTWTCGRREGPSALQGDVVFVGLAGKDTVECRALIASVRILVNDAALIGVGRLSYQCNESPLELNGVLPHGCGEALVVDVLVASLLQAQR